MEILKAIERADALLPNHYTLDEKLSWCDEVTAELRRSVIKVYDAIETEADAYGKLILPDDIPFEHVEVVLAGNQMLSKEDFRSMCFADRDASVSFGMQKKLRVVYLVLPKPIRTPDIRGEFNTGENYVEIEEPPFITGDKIEIVPVEALTDEPDRDNAKHAYVMESQLHKIILDRDVLEAQTGAKLAIRRVIDDVTEVDEPPYDGMYIEYLLAKMALYQHDYVGYNAHMTQYNSLYEMFRREYKTRSPMTSRVRLKNYSIL